MTRRSLAFASLFAVVALAAAPSVADAQLGSTEIWASHVSNEFRVVPNVTYHVANGSRTGSISTCRATARAPRRS